MIPKNLVAFNFCCIFTFELPILGIIFPKRSKPPPAFLNAEFKKCQYMPNEPLRIPLLFTIHLVGTVHYNRRWNIFSELVMGAHLKPLEKGEQLDAFTKSRNQPWNVSFSPGAQGSSQSASDTQLGDSYQTIDLPLNHAQFNLIWKRCCQDESSRYQFLLRYVNEGVDLSSVFKTDLPSAIFTQCIAAVNECFCTDDQNSIIAILTALTQSKRFKLALKFLSKSEKDVLADLIDKLDEDKVSSSQLDQHYKEALD